MTDPYLAPSLAVLRAEINQRWPRRDHTSDGWIGDAAHQARTSDHNPNARGSVDALDVDVDGVDVEEIKAAFQRHPSAHYWIHNRQIADQDDGWRRRPYSGPNPHTEHLHGSIRQTREAEQDTRPWGLLEDDMPLDNADVMKVWTWDLRNGDGVDPAYVVLNRAATEATKARLTGEAVLAAVKGLDTKAVLARIDQVATEDRQRDAELTELCRQGQSGQMAAEEVLRRMGELLIAGTPAPQ